MSLVRKHLTFENVLVTVIAFVVLAGGTAFAANQLAKNSVGKKQLKANAVTTAKIKKEAVTLAKIKAGAIDATKVKDTSLTLADLDKATLPFGHIVHEAHGTGSVAVAPPFSVIPIDKPAYTQEAGSDDKVVGAADISFDPACPAGKERIAFLYVVLDVPDPTKIANLDTAVATVFTSTKGKAPTTCG